MGKKILVREIDLCENFPDTQGHPRNLGFLDTLGVHSFAHLFLCTGILMKENISRKKPPRAETLFSIFL